jgi:hypothetical protein
MKQFIFQFFVLLLVVQTFNMSINSWMFYTPVDESTFKAENRGSIVDDEDYIDSMVEFLVENVMGFSKKTFHDKANCNNTQKQQNTVHFDLKWSPNTALVLSFNKTTRKVVNIIPQNEAFINLYFKEVPVKPPQLLSA